MVGGDEITQSIRFILILYFLIDSKYITSSTKI